MEMKYNPENNIFVVKDDKGNFDGITAISIEVYSKIRSSIKTIVEEYQIRLTPSEFRMLEDSYIDRYVDNIDISGLIQLSENIKRRK